MGEKKGKRKKQSKKRKTAGFPFGFPSTPTFHGWSPVPPGPRLRSEAAARVFRASSRSPPRAKRCPNCESANSWMAAWVHTSSPAESGTSGSCPPSLEVWRTKETFFGADHVLASSAKAETGRGQNSLNHWDTPFPTIMEVDGGSSPKGNRSSSKTQVLEITIEARRQPRGQELSGAKCQASLVDSPQRTWGRTRTMTVRPEPQLTCDDPFWDTETIQGPL